MNKLCSIFMGVCIAGTALADSANSNDIYQRTQWVTNQPMIYMLFDFVNPPQEDHAFAVEAKKSWGYMDADHKCQIFGVKAHDRFGTMTVGDDLYWDAEGLDILKGHLGDYDCLHYDFSIKGQPSLTSITYHFVVGLDNELDRVEVLDHSEYVEVAELPGKEKVAAARITLP